MIYEETGELLDYAVTMIKLSSQVNVERSERFDHFLVFFVFVSSGLCISETIPLLNQNF